MDVLESGRETREKRRGPETKDRGIAQGGFRGERKEEGRGAVLKRREQRRGQREENEMMGRVDSGGKRRVVTVRIDEKKWQEKHGADSGMKESSGKRREKKEEAKRSTK